MGGFRTGTSRYSEQIFSVDVMENNFKWNKTRKGGKNVYEANQPEKKKLKRERERIVCLPGYFIKSFTV